MRAGQSAYLSLCVSIGDNWAGVGPCPLQEPAPSHPSLVSAQFQVFLKQINSSLVDSNMLVRCVTLSLDRFENQVDMKGKKRPEANADPFSVASLVSHTQFSARRRERLEEATPNAHVDGVKVVALWVIFFAAVTFLCGSCFL